MDGWMDGWRFKSTLLRRGTILINEDYKSQFVHLAIYVDLPSSYFIIKQTVYNNAITWQPS